ncbi:MAG: methyltransferase domain-containing protein [Lentisphaerae bacterium]|nr:methyltransferase domain-containing protein [Lentisphaerota bacterium]MCP4101135.1 methyltransferase domain-containing protein [Lentisphaerota bacterium]
MFQELEEINKKPKPFEFYTAEELWTNQHTAEQMLKYHLNESVDLSSRNKKFIGKSSAWIIDHFNLNEKSKVIDFGCGPGLYTTRFAECGAQVTGLDFSDNSIQYAKKTAASKGFDINYIKTNYLDFKTEEKFDLITMIMCDFCALSPEQRMQLLSIFKGILASGGSILLDVYTISAFNKRAESAGYEANLLNNFWSPDKYYGFLNVFKYDAEKVVLDKYTIIEESRARTVYNWLQYFNENSISSEISDNSLVIKELYSDVAGTEYCIDNDEMALVIG